MKKDFDNVLDFFKNKKLQNYLIFALILGIIIFGFWIRIQNLNLLVDSTTGNSIPLALDPYYFLRGAETIVENSGELPEVDSMRKPFDVPWTKEILPQSTILIWKIINVFSSQEISIAYAHNLNPVIFFVLGLIIYFLLIWFLTNSKLTALISSFFLTIIPAYLYRTLAGFGDHEAIGMFAFFLCLLSYGFLLKYLEKEKNKKILWKSILAGAILGFLTNFVIISWGGVSKFIFMIFPASFLVIWLIKTQNNEFNKKILMNFIGFYFTWILSTLIFAEVFGKGFIQVLNASLLVSSGLISLFVLGLIIVDFFVLWNLKKIKIIYIEKYRILFSVLGTIVLGLIFLFVVGKDISGIFSDVINRILHPFGTDRLGLTVSENKQPSLNDWINQVGRPLFYLFLAGLFFIGENLSNLIKNKKEKFLFLFAWVIFILGIIFSRVSESSQYLNGVHPLSKLIYFGSILFFIGICFYVYYNSKIKLDSKLILIFSWMIFMLISGRGAVRLFFVITPFMIFMMGYAILNLYKYSKKIKDKSWRNISYAVLVLVVLGLSWITPSIIQSTLLQAENTGPSANLQWQNTMKWVRENTSPSGVFSHWWDYGYWVQYLGERATIADGGHFQGTYRDHMIGRYILTETNPNLTQSFIQSNNVTYLLVDPTDIGKYTAYSSIGSSEKWDRIAAISTFTSSQENIRETSTSLIKIYQGGAGVEDDLIYKKNNTELFLPGATYDKLGNPSYKAYLGGIILERKNNASVFEQPVGVFVYNGQQINIPLRYIYIRGELIDFGSGIEAGIYLYPRIYQSAEGTQIDETGSAFYFSPRTINSLVVQLYIMDDPQNRYPDFELIHSEDNQIVKSLKAQFPGISEFINFQGIQGPIKIWKISYSDKIIEREEFTRKFINKYAEFDDLDVVRV